MGYVEITTRVVPASREALECFSLKDLQDYAVTLGLPRQRKKGSVIFSLLSRKATLCASLKGTIGG